MRMCAGLFVWGMSAVIKHACHVLQSEQSEGVNRPTSLAGSKLRMRLFAKFPQRWVPLRGYAVRRYGGKVAK